MSNQLKKVELYSDGACSGNPGPGGWAAILRYEEHEKIISGNEENTTNNRMELTAAIEGLKLLKMPCEVMLYSDSQYLINGMSKGWAKSWKQNGWKKKDRKPALNSDLWEELLLQEEIHQIHYIWVKGHAENPYNNRCDQLAVEERSKLIT